MEDKNIPRSSTSLRGEFAILLNFNFEVASPTVTHKKPFGFAFTLAVMLFRMLGTVMRYLLKLLRN